MKKLLSKVLVFAVLGLAALGSAAAETVPYADAGLSLEVPDGWKKNTLNNGALQITDANGDVSFTFHPMESVKALGKAKAQVQKAIKGLMTKIVIDKGTKFDSNGMPSIIYKGKAMLKNPKVALKLAIIVIQTPSDKLFMVLGFADASKFDANKAGIEQVLTGFKPLAP